MKSLDRIFRKKTNQHLSDMLGVKLNVVNKLRGYINSGDDPVEKKVVKCKKMTFIKDLEKELFDILTNGSVEEKNSKKVKVMMHTYSNFKY